MAMTEEEMRIECLRLEIPAMGLDKSAIQRQLLGYIVARATSSPASQTTAPLVYAAVNVDPPLPDQEGERGAPAAVGAQKVGDEQGFRSLHPTY